MEVLKILSKSSPLNDLSDVAIIFLFLVQRVETILKRGFYG
nr:MAG TPA: Golgi resident protein GCP60, 3A, GOLD, 3A, Aichivirus, Antiviral [Caudoviricetes sp.]DAS73676.1 MAG TPA: Golgi resident protein GCP60, 3A, GOLD, 3A, Aichivirus, Antiviral [Caudoviricetes sp.]DAV35402.1 MAG TPA: Golgi resident protein GCP60, 3A, GOLD, 3A, Aichivirus, Antiviral [Bacteriophage sp.]DAX88848.1 MAG TPA: Golgi resident protein GCP60, 3A, GOLD, 3A, Aichivirus, Antiviral [Caudoviricetes sp.]DAY39392.1 MAG TPA: Golgi resident protein GCP60, 3A, GOLD, 3A, Aichivirus, Antivira